MLKWFGSHYSSEKASDKVPGKSPEKDGLSSAFSLTGKSFIGRIFQQIQDRFSQTGGQQAPGEETLADAPLSDDFIDDLEETLIRCDIGLKTAVDITDEIRKSRGRLKKNRDVLVFLKEKFIQILQPYQAANQLKFDPARLNVYLVVGVNGAGKTTFIGKLAHRFTRQGIRVIVGAGDTFRAAAEEQVEIWAERAGAFVVRAEHHSDPSAVMFEAIRQAQETGAKVVILDTAGRLQNKFNLMEELKKIKKVIEKAMPPDAVFESLLVLDATTGQNALKQAEVFREAAGVTGVILTKMDSSAKGGIILTIAREYQLPVKMVGVGERIDDLLPFDAGEYVSALFQ